MCDMKCCQVTLPKGRINHSCDYTNLKYGSNFIHSNSKLLL